MGWRRGTTPAFWAWNVAAWAGIGLIAATQTVFVMRSQGMHHDWTALMATQLLAWLPWALATPVVLFAARRFPIGGRQTLGALGCHLLAACAIALASSAWIAAIERVWNPWSVGALPPFGRLWMVRLQNGLLQTVFLYAGIVAADYALDARDRLLRQEAETARLNDQLAQAQLRALQQQLEPHFLFNALNAVTSLVREGRNDAAVRAVAGLSDCLRRVLSASDGQVVTLGHELEFVDRYLALQRLRFGDGLRLSVEVPSELLGCRVPNLVLHPIVDNAVKHGVADRVGGGTIRIGATGSEETLTLTVYNDRPRTAARAPKPGFGIGLSHLRARLRMLYGEAFCLSVDDERNGVCVSVSLPMER
jgi:hypothetical protein